MIKFLDLQKQYLSIQDEIDTAIKSVIHNSSFIGGKDISCFEESFADYQNSSHCIGVANGTDALEIAIESLDLPKNSEVIVPANSFISSAEAVSRQGLKVVFCDVNSSDFTINIKDLEKRLTSKTSAIMAVHLYGHPCDMDSLSLIAKNNNLRIIEDCAQAHGAEYKDKRVGSIGDIGCFSFYPGKNLGAYGDAGAIVTNDETLAKKSRMIANHGRIEKYNHEFEGRNSRMDGLQAAILNIKLTKLDMWTSQRILLADTYLDLLKDFTEITLPSRKEWAKQVYHLFVIRSDSRDSLQKSLKEEGIATGIHYPIALPKLKAFEYLNQSKEEGFAWTSDNTLLSLPIGDHLDVEDLIKVKEALTYIGIK
jgi:dTDP-4-amino-4,6-dideoxygalactose transaminase